MTKYELNLTNIDEASKTVTDFLSNEKVSSKKVNLFCLQTELVELSGSLQTLKTDVLRNKAL